MLVVPLQLYVLFLMAHHRVLAVPDVSCLCHVVLKSRADFCLKLILIIWSRFHLAHLES